jgi:hypothetical protein
MMLAEIEFRIRLRLEVAIYVRYLNISVGMFFGVIIRQIGFFKWLRVGIN